MNEFLYGLQRGLILVGALFVLPAQSVWLVLRAIFRHDGAYVTSEISWILKHAWTVADTRYTVTEAGKRKVEERNGRV